VKKLERLGSHRSARSPLANREYSMLVLPNLLTIWQRGLPRKRWGNDTPFEVGRSGSGGVFRHKRSEVKSNGLPGFDHLTSS
jgi:hypothetical protein